MHNAKLVLQDGAVFTGYSFGSTRMKVGDVIVQTGMTGYQEILSDPAHANHIIVMSYPLIGNYGFNHDDFESIEPLVQGLVVREKCNHPSNYRSTESLESYTSAHQIPAIEGIDTRKITHHIRTHGTMKGIIVPLSVSTEEACAHIEKPSEDVSVSEEEQSMVRPYVIPGRGKRLVLIDLGLKHGILRALTKRNCHVTVVPHNYGIEEIMRLQPDGIVLSNGPKEVSDVQPLVEIIAQLLGKTPVFGIGLGHHVFAKACGADVQKKTNERYVTGLPVTSLQTNETFFTSMHQSGEVIEKSLEELPLEIIERVADDHSIASLQHTEYNAFSVQYNPESAPGPDETNHLFDQFLLQCSTKRNS